MDRVPEELWIEVHNTVQNHPKKKKCKKAKWFSEAVLQIAEKRREAKDKGDRKRDTQPNAEFQRINRKERKESLPQ